MAKHPPVDFRSIAPRNGSQADAFEEFCCQIARQSADVPDGSEFLRYRGSGGDGGVECIWKLPNGEEWGWQAKYRFRLEQAKSALDESVDTALKIHPRLTRYTICLPFDLTGPTARKGKSQAERFEGYRANWQKAAQEANVQMEIVLATPSTLMDELLTFDSEGGRLRYWFDANILGDQWFSNHLEDARASAYPRYTPELRIGTPVAEAFEALGLTEEWFAPLAARAGTFRRILKEWKSAVQSTGQGAWSVAYPQELRLEGEQACEFLEEMYQQYCQIAEFENITVNIAELADHTNRALRFFRKIRTTLAAKLETEYGEGTADSASFRQFQAEYQASFPAAHVDAADEVIEFLEGFYGWITSPATLLMRSPELLLLGYAGVGKTHAICDIADLRAKRGLRTIVLFGEKLTKHSEPWEQIRQQLGFDTTLTRDAMLAALDAAGEASGKPFLLCIDGINETRPRSFWRNHLPALVTQLRRYEWIRLCVSCRTTYESQVIPESLDLTSITHEGFAGIEFDACHEFFSYYRLEPPVTPILQPELTNPLFLRLICEAMVAAGYKRLPSGWHGINTAINAFIQSKNRDYADQHDLLPSHRCPEQGLKAFIAVARAKRCSAVPWSEASRAIESVLPPSHTGELLTDWLVHEGMLIVDADPNTMNGTSEDYVRIAFERLGDHLLASRLLEGFDNETIISAFDDDGALAFAVVNEDAVKEHRGLIEALAIQLPERFGIELPDSVGDDVVRRYLVKATVETLPWRDSTLITARTCHLLEYSLTFHEFAWQAFDCALSIATYPSAADAFWLHNILQSRSMPERDAFWCGYLHKGYEERRPVEKLLRAAFKVEVDHVPVEITERWAIVLLWFCAAADRRVRDQATKALVRIMDPYPALWESLTERFVAVDDEFVVECCLASAYGTLLRMRDKSAEHSLAGVVFAEVLRDSSRFQNAIIRDYARSILELANYHNVLPEGIAEEDYLPPYTSDWPLDIPSEDDVEGYRDSYQEMPRLYHSCVHDDFNRYTLNRLYAYQENVDRASMGRWIFQHVLDMGYTSERFANYDGYMMYRYGGGRGKPKWAERIGKKYQWIALARLAARMTDHIMPRRDQWDPKPLQTPLTYQDGRDLDPSLLLRSSPAGKAECWWISESYDFAAVSEMDDKEWTSQYDDMPVPSLEPLDEKGKHWTILEAYPGWNSRSSDTDQTGTYRMVWLHLHSYLISSSDQALCWGWLQKQQFMGRWMPEGASLHGGFIGEYPWAVPFNLYEDTYYLYSGSNSKKPPCEMYPACNTLSVNYEYDSFQEDGIMFCLPARRFFDVVSLRWNRLSGYENEGRLLFLDPSVVDPGPSALLVDLDFLHAFLVEHGLALVWTVLGEKLTINYQYAPRLAYSRAYMLDTDGHIRSSQPVISDSLYPQE